MQLLNKKKREEKKRREELSDNNANRTVEERVDHCKHLQYEKHQELFSVQYSSIHKAAIDNSIHGMKYFLSPFRSFKCHVDDYDKNGCTPLHLAAERGSNTVVQFIIEHGCDINLRTTYGSTALMHACKENKIETIRLLMAAGSDVNIRNKAGLTAIHFAAQSDSAPAIELVINLLFEASLKSNKLPSDSINLPEISQNNGVSRKPSSLNATTASIATAKSDFNSLPLLEMHSTNLATPLHTACLFNSVKVVQYLISQGVNLNFKNSSGETPLHIAGRNKYFQIYHMLKEAGAAEDTKNGCNQTPQELLKDIIVI